MVYVKFPGSTSTSYKVIVDKVGGPNADMNDDGVVNFLDFAILIWELKPETQHIFRAPENLSPGAPGSDSTNISPLTHYIPCPH